MIIWCKNDELGWKSHSIEKWWFDEEKAMTPKTGIFIKNGSWMVIFIKNLKKWPFNIKKCWFDAKMVF